MEGDEEGLGKGGKWLEAEEIFRWAICDRVSCPGTFMNYWRISFNI